MFSCCNHVMFACSDRISCPMRKILMRVYVLSHVLYACALMKFVSLHLLQRILYGECEHCRRDLQEIQLHYQPSDCEDVPEMVEEFYEHKRQEETVVCHLAMPDDSDMIVSTSDEQDQEDSAINAAQSSVEQSRLAAQGRSSDVNEGPPSTDKKDIHEHSSDFDVSLAVFNESINVRFVNIAFFISVCLFWSVICLPLTFRSYTMHKGSESEYFRLNVNF